MKRVNAKATYTKQAEELFADKIQAKELFKKIQEGDDPIVLKNGIRITRHKRKK